MESDVWDFLLLMPGALMFSSLHNDDVIMAQLVFLWGYSCMSSQINAAIFIWDLMVLHVVLSLDIGFHAYIYVTSPKASTSCVCPSSCTLPQLRIASPQRTVSVISLLSL